MAMPVRAVDRVGRLARAGLDHATFQRKADQVLRSVVAYDIATWATVDPGSLLLTSCTPVGDHPFQPEHRPGIFEMEYLGTEPLTVSRLIQRKRPAGTLRTEVDDPNDTKRYREHLAPFDINDELVTAFVVDGRCWGAVRVFRRADRSRPFTERDVDCFVSASATLAEGLRLAFLRAATEAIAGVDHPPGVVTVDAFGSIEACTRDAQPWLDSLDLEGDVPAVLASLAARVATHDEASAVMVGSRGPVALHASRLKGSNDQIAVVIERPRPRELMPRVMEAYDLTARESQVTEHVLRGSSTVQITRAMDVSGHTVQDHLKSIFAKIGVRTRGELANAVHVRFYLPPAPGE
jgi:DNA-binding CsgD family transcriptional regulator